MKNLMSLMKNLMPLFSRFLLVLVFVLSALGQIKMFLGVKIYMAINGIPEPDIFLSCAIILNIIASICIILGYKIKIATIALIIFLIPTTLIFHRDVTNAKEAMDFAKNLSILGGLVMLYIHGSGPYSLDNFLKNRKKSSSLKL